MDGREVIPVRARRSVARRGRKQDGGRRGDLDGVEQRIHDETRTAIRSALGESWKPSSRLAGP